MTENMKHWDALSKTDPKHTKPFKRSGGFQGTAIKPIWLTKRLTEHFGAAGTGWGMEKPEFQVVAAAEEILVFCTVALWYTTANGPATVYGVGGDKVMGKNKYGAFTNDEAFKASYTDALSNAMKQIGMGADIHMGLFEDEKYVRETTREFAVASAKDRAVFVGSPQTGDADDYIPAEDKHLLRNGETRSTYQIATADKSPGRLTAELWASSAVTLFNQPGYSLLDYKEWKVTPYTNKGTKTNEQKLAELREKHSDLADKIDEAVSNLSAVAA